MKDLLDLIIIDDTRTLNQALQYGDNWFLDLSTDCEPSEVRMEMDRARGTLHVRIDERRESFLFHGVPPHARPFVNLWLLEDQVSLPDFLHD